VKKWPDEWFPVDNFHFFPFQPARKKATWTESIHMRVANAALIAVGR
jgi:hypothetical protein